MSPLPDFKKRTLEAHARGGPEGAWRLLDEGRRLLDAKGPDLAAGLRAGGSIVFPHATYEVCGHHVAAAVHACLDSGADRVVALGVLHGRTPELEAARARVTAGGAPEAEPLRGIRGPDLPGHDDWRREFSLDHFAHLWGEETRRRGIAGPELVLRWPFLAGDRPRTLPGIDELERLAGDSVIVATADPCHHGIGYGDPPEAALAPEEGGLALARRRIEEGLAFAGEGRFADFQRHCVQSRSDARDTVAVLAHLLGPFDAEVLDLLADDMTGPYDAPPPTWVAAALVAVRKR